jgi:hypothetical protein
LRVPDSEFGIETGFLTAHFNRGRDLNGENYGRGAENKFDAARHTLGIEVESRR